MSEFIGLVTEDGAKLLLDFPKAFKAFYKRFAGHEVVVTVAKRSEAKTRKQEAGFHAMIAPWCREKGHRPDDLKLDLLGEIFGWSEAPSPLTGRTVPLKTRTRDLNKQEYSQLIEQTMEIAADVDGFVLIAPEEYKALHPERYPEYAKKRRRAA
jgi:hypothetical protein